jgi:hypothetical protein
MSKNKQFLWPLGAGLVGMLFLTSIYFVIVSIAESPGHAIDLFWKDRLIIAPIILGFGIQSALYIVLKKHLFIPVANTGPSGALTGAGGTTSTVAMVACCAHHVTDVLPVLGLSATAAFLAEYRIPFMLIGLGINLIGIVMMLALLLRERQKAIRRVTSPVENNAYGVMQ